MPKLDIYKLSRAPAQGFPVNFRTYVQDVSLSRAPSGSWEIRSAASAGGGLGVKEEVSNPYVKISDAGGRELARLVLRPGRLPSAEPWAAEAKETVPDIPEGTVIDFGYEYLPAPRTTSYTPEEPLRKEYRLPGGMDAAGRKEGQWSGRLWFAAVPGPGGYHFQTVAAVFKDDGVFVRSRVFGPALRYGNGRIDDPYVLITDAAGSEIKKIKLFSGRLGAFDADAKGPAEASILLPGLPPRFRLFIGHENGAARPNPEDLTGPYRLELPSLPAPPGPESQI